MFVVVQLYMWCVLVHSHSTEQKSGIFRWCSKYVVSAAFLFRLKRRHILVFAAVAATAAALRSCVFAIVSMAAPQFSDEKFHKLPNIRVWYQRWQKSNADENLPVSILITTISEFNTYENFNKIKNFLQIFINIHYLCSWMLETWWFTGIYLKKHCPKINYSTGKFLRFLNEWSWRFDFNFNWIFIEQNDRQRMHVNVLCSWWTVTKEIPDFDTNKEAAQMSKFLSRIDFQRKLYVCNRIKPKHRRNIQIFWKWNLGTTQWKLWFFSSFFWVNDDDRNACASCITWRWWIFKIWLKTFVCWFE